MLKCKLLSHYFSYSAMRDLFFNCCCPFFSHENGREVLKFLGLNVTQILTALWPHSNFRSKYNIYYRGASFWSTENVDDEGCLLSRGWKINGAWMSGFTVPGDKRHMHFAHHKMETLLICIITACKECSRKLFISNKIVL